jgi:phospholipid/cholesterol/gamma-HCH transport system permease protein
MKAAEYVAGSLGFSISEVGAVFLLLLAAIRRAPRAIRQKHLTLEQMQRIGIGSLPLVLVTSVFTGGVAAVQAAYQFQNYVPLRYLGMVIGKSVVIELGPVLTALVVGGRVGASIAAELGTMKVTEQIEALETLAIDPVRYLVSPRLIAAVVMLPVITVFSDFIAVMGGFAVAYAGLSINTHIYFSSIKAHLDTGDVFSGLVKAFFFGGIIAMMGCYHGMKTRGGAEGVGMATTKAVVSSCLLILITDYILASLLFNAVFAG